MISSDSVPTMSEQNMATTAERKQPQDKKRPLTETFDLEKIKNAREKMQAISAKRQKVAGSFSADSESDSIEKRKAMRKAVYQKSDGGTSFNGVKGRLLSHWTKQVAINENTKKNKLFVMFKVFDVADFIKYNLLKIDDEYIPKLIVGETGFRFPSQDRWSEDRLYADAWDLKSPLIREGTVVMLSVDAKENHKALRTGDIISIQGIRWKNPSLEAKKKKDKKKSTAPGGGQGKKNSTSAASPSGKSKSSEDSDSNSGETTSKASAGGSPKTPKATKGQQQPPPAPAASAAAAQAQQQQQQNAKPAKETTPDTFFLNATGVTIIDSDPIVYPTADRYILIPKKYPRPPVIDEGPSILSSPKNCPYVERFSKMLNLALADDKTPFLPVLRNSPKNQQPFYVLATEALTPTLSHIAKCLRQETAESVLGPENSIFRDITRRPATFVSLSLAKGLEATKAEDLEGQKKAVEKAVKLLKKMAIKGKMTATKKEIRALIQKALLSVKPFCALEMDILKMVVGGNHSGKILRCRFNISIFSKQIASEFGIANPVAFNAIMNCGMNMPPMVLIARPDSTQTLDLESNATNKQLSEYEHIIQTNYGGIEPETQSDVMDIFNLYGVDPEELKDEEGNTTTNGIYDIITVLSSSDISVNLPLWITTNGINITRELCIEYCLRFLTTDAEKKKICNSIGINKELLKEKEETGVPKFDVALLSNIKSMNVSSIFSDKATVVVSEQGTEDKMLRNVLNMSYELPSNKHCQSVVNLTEFKGDLMQFFTPVPVVRRRSEELDKYFWIPIDDSERQKTDFEELEKDIFYPFDFYVMSGDDKKGKGCKQVFDDYKEGDESDDEDEEGEEENGDDESKEGEDETAGGEESSEKSGKKKGKQSASGSETKEVKQLSEEELKRKMRLFLFKPKNVMVVFAVRKEFPQEIVYPPSRNVKYELTANLLKEHEKRVNELLQNRRVVDNEENTDVLMGEAQATAATSISPSSPSARQTSLQNEDQDDIQNYRTDEGDALGGLEDLPRADGFEEPSDNDN